MKRMMVLVCLSCTASISGAQDLKTPVPIFSLGDRFELVGELGVKLGETVTVDGTVVEGPFKGYEGGPNLIVKRVNGKSDQRKIQIPISPYFGEFGKANFDGKPLPKCEPGSTYRLRVYETGEFVGVPSNAYQEAGIALQTTGFYFRNSLRVLSGDKIDSIVWEPNDFIDREALLFGIARNENGAPIIESTNWKLVLAETDKWSDAELGKQVEVLGTIRVTAAMDTYRVENCRARLISLGDQLGKQVALRGTARSLNGRWWFNYRGTDIYVEGMAELPNWTPDNHWRPIEIAGRLEQAELPKLDQLSANATYYIVRRPTWTPIRELLEPELPPEE